MGRRRGSRKLRAIRLDAELMRALKEQLEAFRQKFGRDPGPEDPLFFDPEADQPRPMDDGQLDGMVVDALRHAGADPAYIHAYKRTGVLITTDNFKRWRKRELEEFREALEEWERLWERRN
jgi:hypothetical protein